MIQKLEILLVEDNPYDAELTIAALRGCQLDHHLLHLKDGSAALDFLFNEAHPLPKFVLLDLKLPKVDGFEVLRQIRQNNRTKLLPVVVLSSSREESDLRQSYHLGANSFILKPVESENFSKAIARLGLYWLHLNEPALRIS